MGHPHTLPKKKKKKWQNNGTVVGVAVEASGVFRGRWSAFFYHFRHNFFQNYPQLFVSKMSQFLASRMIVPHRSLLPQVPHRSLLSQVSNEPSGMC